MTELNRRQLLAISAGAMAITVLPVASGWAAANDSQKLIDEFTGGKATKEGALSLDLPEIAENGNTVPLTVSVGGTGVESVLILAAGNPRAGVATFHFGPAAGSAEASTRMRLAKTQDIIAVAKLSDGSFVQGQKTVKVTIGGCGG